VLGQVILFNNPNPVISPVQTGPIVAYGSFERMFTLPGSVEAERIQAKVENGLLMVTLPKAERARPRQIEIKS